jgi:photosystem II stability/assembly factor-like uncharacterized protein
MAALGRIGARARAARTLVAALALGALPACHEMHFEPRTVAGEIDIYDDLFTVSAPAADHVVAAGYWGAIYVSQDRGKSWHKAETGTKHLLYDVSMADATRGWAVGQLGTILRTEDGGLTWKPQENAKVAQGVHLFSVQALDADRAWAVGEWGTRIYTDDGGRNWADHSLTIDETHPQFVWLSIPDQERVRRGEPVFEDVTLNDVHCLPEDRQRCWMIGEFGYIFRTETGGVSPENRSPSWERGQIVGGLRIDPIVMGYNEIQLREEHERTIAELAKMIADQQHLNIAIEPRVSAQEIREFTAGGDPTPLFEIIEARTQEVQAVVEEAGILSDRIRRRGAPPWDYEDFIDEDPGFLERYLESRRADFAGIEVQVAQNPYLFSIRFADEFHGLISGLGGVILKTGDGGRTWEYENVGRKQALFSIQPFSSKRAIVVGEKGFMRESNDGGATWETPGGFPTIFTFMRDLTFTSDRRIGYIVGQRGLVLRSEDGGKTWAQVLGGRGAEAAG